MRLRVGLSTCPNDTFAFHGILERQVDMRGLEVEAELLDVQQLNDGLFADRYDVSKASFHAALLLAGRYGVLGAGSALGFGVGPAAGVRLARTSVPSAGVRVVCPGRTTTATLLYRCLHPGQGTVSQSRLLGHRRRPARRPGRPRRADPRGPADLPARRPAAGRGSRRLVRAAGGGAGAAGRNPGLAALPDGVPPPSRPCCATRSPTAGRTARRRWPPSAATPRSWTRT